MGYKATPRGERARLLDRLEQHPEKVTSQLLLQVVSAINADTFENPELVQMLKDLDEYADKLAIKRRALSVYQDDRTGKFQRKAE